MVFVLGILMLVALVGLVMIARTHGESKRVAFESTSSAKRAATDGVINNIRETLRRDIWGTDSNENYPLRGLTQSDDNPQETNEPYDAPGPSDRWLASSVPYLVGTIQPDPSDPLTLEEDVLAYHRVSYLGSDIFCPPTNNTPYAWADNARTPTVPGDYTLYDDSNLQDVQILQTPPPIYAGIPLIPGSTTNLTIAQARAVWESSAHQTELATVLPGRRHQFPYFDTNADGKLDLYDADGDGIPDSPISLTIPVNTADPNEPKTLYASIKVIDHSAMLNVNVASSMERPGAAGLMFNEGSPARQRRGRHLTELLLEEVAHEGDWSADQRTANTVAFRSSGTVPADHPLSFDQDIVRRQLIGGIPTGLNYFLYGSSDEASLRHRGNLAPSNLGDFDKTAAASADDYRTIDKALRWTSLWNRSVVGVAPYNYNAGYSRWNRLHSGYEPKGATTTYEGYDDGFGKGWRSLLQQDQPFAIRRSLLTTVSLAVEPAPAGLEFERDWIADDPTYDRVTLSTVPDVPVGETRLTALPRRNDVTRQAFLDGVGALAMSWPVINRNLIADDGSIAEWLRVLPIDLNMTANDVADAPIMKATFIEHVAAAMYLALDGVSNVQGIPLETAYHTVVATNPTPPAPPPTMEELNREYLAWQFAINLADYRDEDDVPTALQWPFGSGRYIFGIEKQPFFTEAYAYLVAGTGPPSGPSGESHPNMEDRWFTAVELYIPPGWNIPTANLYFRMPGADPDPGFMPIHNFLPVGTAPNLVAGSLSGGPANVTFVTDSDHGNYWVFCNATTNAPLGLLGEPNFLASAYQHPAFNIARDGHGRIELWYSPDGVSNNPRNHILDMIGPEQSGGELADDTNGGDGIWAIRDDIFPNTIKQYSLLRSTKGWRFTTGWHVHTHQPNHTSSPNDRRLRRSLGGPNDTINSLDHSVPESIWPARVNQINQTPAGGFYSGQPYEAFDSVAELSRMLTIGSLNRPPSLAPQLIPGGSSQPATVFLAEIINHGTGDFPDGGHTKDRIAAGRVDFVDAKRKAHHPWTERLFTYFTTRSPLHDGVDNDGDDPGDGSLTDWNDPTEGISTLYRVAGRININTAPQAVLRSVPFMSLLPTSPEYIYHAGPAVDPAAALTGNPTFFWDFPTAIVAAREDRAVTLRLVDAAGLMQPSAVAQRMGPADANAPAAIGAFTSVGELARLSHLYDNPTGNHSLFDVQRFSSDAGLALTNHKTAVSHNPGPNLGDDPARSPFSPDFRYRGDTGEMNYIPIMLPAPTLLDQAVGIRGRDIFLTRWTSLLTTRSDCFTVYIAMLDEHGNYVSRSQVTLDRSVCFAEVPSQGSEPRKRILPTILNRSDSSYADDTR